MIGKALGGGDSPTSTASQTDPTLTASKSIRGNLPVLLYPIQLWDTQKLDRSRWLLRSLFSFLHSSLIRAEPMGLSPVTTLKALRIQTTRSVKAPSLVVVVMALDAQQIGFVKATLGPSSFPLVLVFLGSLVVRIYADTV